MQTIFNCPRCGAPVVHEYTDTSGEHWHCNNCGRNDRSFIVYIDTTTGTTILKEVPLSVYDYVSYLREPLQWEDCTPPNSFTPGGDPVVRCPKCKSPNSEHLGGVEGKHWNFCPMCGIPLKD